MLIRLHVLRNTTEKIELERSRAPLLEQFEQANYRLLERVAPADPLTGLYNRRTIEEVARFELKRRIRYPSPLSISLIDVDRFDLHETGHLKTASQPDLT